MISIRHLAAPETTENTAEVKRDDDNDDDKVNAIKCNVKLKINILADDETPNRENTESSKSVLKKTRSKFINLSS